MKGLDWRRRGVCGLAAGAAAGGAAGVRRAQRARRICGEALLRVAGAAALAVAYGTAGFWLLERHHFRGELPPPGRAAAGAAPPRLRRRPRAAGADDYARWFLDSLYLTTVAAIVYAGFVALPPGRPPLPRPSRTSGDGPRRSSRNTAAPRSTSSSIWPDKSFFFAPGGEAFVAYRVGGRHAIVLGDPVGPEEAIEPIVRAFRDFCRENDWGLAFHQTLPDFLPVYERLGLPPAQDRRRRDRRSRRLHARRGANAREFRNTIANLERQGVTCARHEPPLAGRPRARAAQRVGRVAAAARPARAAVHAWGCSRTTTCARHAGRRWRAAATGASSRSPTSIRSYAPGEATIDLMRHRCRSPTGRWTTSSSSCCCSCREAGFTRFNLGMAPMSGFAPSGTVDAGGTRAARLLPAPELPVQLRRAARLQGEVRHRLGAALPRARGDPRAAGRGDRDRAGVGAARPRAGLVTPAPRRRNVTGPSPARRAGQRSGSGVSDARRDRLRGAARLAVGRRRPDLGLPRREPADLWRSLQRTALVVDRRRPSAPTCSATSARAARWSLLLRPLGRVSRGGPPRRSTPDCSPTNCCRCAPARWCARTWCRAGRARAITRGVVSSIAVERLFDGFWLSIAFGVVGARGAACRASWRAPPTCWGPWCWRGGAAAFVALVGRGRPPGRGAGGPRLAAAPVCCASSSRGSARHGARARTSGRRACSRQACWSSRRWRSGW